MLRELRGEYDGYFLIPTRSDDDTIMLYGNEFCETLNLVVAGSRGKLYRYVTIDRMAHYCHFYIKMNPIPSAEEFIDIVTGLYPELAEWLLFHPEWLGKLQDD